MYDKEEQLIHMLNKVTVELKQIQEDKELLQLMIMHQANKADRYYVKGKIVNDN